MKKPPLPNLPTKLFVVLDNRWLVTCEKQCATPAEALRRAALEHDPVRCRVAIPKASYVPPMFE